MRLELAPRRGKDTRMRRDAEKGSAVNAESYFRERAGRADLGNALKILERAGAGNEPMKGDELPAVRSQSRRRGK